MGNLGNIKYPEQSVLHFKNFFEITFHEIIFLRFTFNKKCFADKKPKIAKKSLSVFPLNQILTEIQIASFFLKISWNCNKLRKSDWFGLSELILRFYHIWYFTVQNNIFAKIVSKTAKNIFSTFGLSESYCF